MALKLTNSRGSNGLPYNPMTQPSIAEGEITDAPLALDRWLARPDGKVATYNVANLDYWGVERRGLAQYFDEATWQTLRAAHQRKEANLNI
jgi:hypothetical protein